MFRNTTMIITVRNEVAKVMFLHVSVIFPGGGGGCLVRGGLLPGEGAWSGGVCFQGGAWSRGSAPRGVVVTQHALRQTPPGETATAADGTHPTGMHSC